MNINYEKLYQLFGFHSHPSSFFIKSFFSSKFVLISPFAFYLTIIVRFFLKVMLDKLRNNIWNHEHVRQYEIKEI